SAQPAHVLTKIRIGPQFHAVPIAKGLQRRGKLLRPRKPCLIDKERDDRNLALDRRLNLDPDIVGWVVQPRPAILGASLPSRAYHDEEYVAGGYSLLNHPSEVHSQRDGIDVLEDTAGAELALEPVVQPASEILGIITAV